MALLLAKTSKVLRNQGSKKLSQALIQNAEPYLGSCSFMMVQVANLTSLQGGKAERVKPWPYKTRGFNHYLHPLWECLALGSMTPVRKRFDDNSKLIVVDGPIASGKNEMAKKIAKEFDLLYVPELTDADYFLEEGKGEFDIREYDEQLPIGAKSVDFERFYLQNGSKALLKNFARTQYEMYRSKLNRFAKVVTAHILNTGQGVVMTRGMWSDIIWAHTLNKTGHISGDALKAFQFQYKVSTDYFYKPHLIIYMDAPIEMVKENIKKRNVHWEVNSPVINDQFLHAMEDAYKNVYLPEMKKHGEIMTIDLADEPEPNFEYIVEELELLDLDHKTLENPKRFESWNQANRDFNFLRWRCSYNRWLDVGVREIFYFHPPYECPELLVQGPDLQAQYDTIRSDPRYAYDKKYRPDDPMSYLRFW